MRSMNLVAELKNRRVIRVATIYAVAAWAVIQVADVVGPRLGLPDWTVTLVILLVALGFPVVLVLTWVFDVTPAGIERTRSAPLSPSARGSALILLGMVISLVGFGTYWQVRPQTEVDDDFANSVAVLPFADMSPAGDQEFFGDGITEEILNTLVQLPGLRVPARTSSFSFKGKNLPVREIAKQLGVAHILEGSVRKDGNHVRITAQLIDARTDKHLWSQQYDRELSNVFGVQGEIARAIVEQLQIKLKPGATVLMSEETRNGRAHELYLKGLYYWHRRHADEMPLALDQFRAATKQDPKYANAWAGMALTYAVLPQYTDYDLATAIREGKAAAKRALALDPRNTEAHAALGQIAQELEWDWPAAEKHLDEALRLDSHSATAHQWRAELYTVLGRYEDALGEIDRALELDPLSSVIQNVRALTLWRAGRADESISVWRGIVARDPQYAPARANLVGRLVLLGRAPEALAFAAETSRLQKIVNAIADPAQHGEAMKIMADPVFRAERASLWTLTFMYLALSENDSAAVMLERGAERWEPSLAFFAKDPIAQRLEAKPAFQAYLRKVRLEEHDGNGAGQR